MTNTRPLIIAVEIAGKLPNPHLGPFLKYADNSGLKPDIMLLAAAGEEVASDVLAMLGAHSFKTENPDALPEGICAYFPSPEGRDGLIREALSTGCLVLQTTSENYSVMALEDFEHGFLHNGDAEWYARIFPEPVHLADPAKINLGLGVTVNPRAIVLNKGLEGRGGRVSIGRASHVGADVLLNLGDTDFTVGNFTMISANFAAHAMRHSITHISNFAITKGPFKFFGEVHDGSEPIKIDHDVWIGEGVKCLAGVSIGNGAVVGAASVVTKPVEPYAIYVGNPARLIRYRFSPEKIAFLNECGWWELSFARLREIRESFRMDVTDIPLTELKKLF